MAKKIRDRKEFFLGKIAGREDVDVNTLMPPGASSTEEELLLEIAERIDGIGNNGGGSGEGGGAGLPSVEGSGKALVSVNGEFVEQDGYGYTAVQNVELYNDTPVKSTDIIFDMHENTYNLFTPFSGDDAEILSILYPVDYSGAFPSVLTEDIYINVEVNGVRYENIKVKQAITDLGVIQIPAFGYAGADITMPTDSDYEENPDATPTFDFSEYPFVITLANHSNTGVDIITEEAFNPAPTVKIAVSQEVTTPIDSKYIDQNGLADIISSISGSHKILLDVYDGSFGTNNETFKNLLDEWCTAYVQNNSQGKEEAEYKINEYDVYMKTGSLASSTSTTTAAVYMSRCTAIKFSYQRGLILFYFSTGATWDDPDARNVICYYDPMAGFEIIESESEFDE